MNKIAEFYDALAIKHGRTEAACDAQDPEPLRQRRRILADFCTALKPPAESVLEVGCAYGALAELLPSHIDYTGVDISSSMLALAMPSPHRHFRCLNVLELRDTWDVVVTEGLFYKLPLEDNFTDPYLLFRKLWSLCRYAMALCALDSNPLNALTGELGLNPLSCWNVAISLTPYVVLRHDFQDRHFCVEMYHRPHLGR